MGNTEILSTQCEKCDGIGTLTSSYEWATLLMVTTLTLGGFITGGLLFLAIPLVIWKGHACLKGET